MKLILNKNSAEFFIKIFVRILIVQFPIFSFSQENKNSFEIYGTIAVDAGYNVNSIQPDWYDVMRPTKLPKYKNEFGTDGNVYYSVRQTKFGVKSSTKTKLGELKTQFDFDLFGFGKDAGQTTFHLINAYGQLGHFGAGQTASAFMDLEVFPITLDYWGPLTRVFNFIAQMRYIPIEKQDERLTIAIERPGATADGGVYTNSIELQGINPDFDFPNLAGHYRRGGKWGYVQIGGLLKKIKWKDLLATPA